MNCGALVGGTKAVWFDDSDNLAAEMSQSVHAVGLAKVGAARNSEMSETTNIPIQHDQRREAYS